MTKPIMISTSQTVRRATSADTPEIARLFQAEAVFEAGMSQGTVALDPDVDWPVFAKRALGSPHSAVFVLGDSSNLQGLIHIRAVTQGRAGVKSALKRLARRLADRSRLIDPGYADYAVIDHIFVEPGARRSGNGERLYEAAAKWAMEREIFEVRGFVWDDSEVAANFWEAMGFRPLRTLFRKTLEQP